MLPWDTDNFRVLEGPTAKEDWSQTKKQATCQATWKVMETWGSDERYSGGEDGGKAQPKTPLHEECMCKETLNLYMFFRHGWPGETDADYMAALLRMQCLLHRLIHTHWSFWLSMKTNNVIFIHVTVVATSTNKTMTNLKAGAAAWCIHCSVDRPQSLAEGVQYTDTLNGA